MLFCLCFVGGRFLLPGAADGGDDGGVFVVADVCPGGFEDVFQGDVEGDVVESQGDAAVLEGLFGVVDDKVRVEFFVGGLGGEDAEGIEGFLDGGVVEVDFFELHGFEFLLTFGQHDA